jgi:hypothetical protein
LIVLIDDFGAPGSSCLTAGAERAGIFDLRQMWPLQYIALNQLFLLCLVMRSRMKNLPILLRYCR